MGERLIKPYEISVWEEKLTQNGFEEVKIAVIGSDTMTGLNKVYDPIFTQKTNGEKSLSFSLRYKYFDPYSQNEGIINPFAALLINERKIKLKYEDKWYEFIVKDHTESSDGLTWSYTCTDAFVLELSKTGYNLTFDADLNNNQGTAIELATKTLKDTDWRIAEDSDTGKIQVDEAIYSATLGNNLSGIEFINTDTNATVSFAAGTQIYIFYNYPANKDGKFVQFILKESPPSVLDDNNTIIATNYRITTDLTFDENTNTFKKNSTVIIQLGNLETQYHAYRLGYNQLTTYDPVMGKTVKRYVLKNDPLQEIYSYSASTQISSGIVTNFITNGDNFNIYDNGVLQGWDANIKTHSNARTNMELVTKPPISDSDPLVQLSSLNQIEGYLKVDFKRWGDIRTNNTYDCIFNSGIEDHVSVLNNIAVNEKFVFRYKAFFTDSQGNIDNNARLRLCVAKYNANESWLDHTVKTIDTGNIILSTNELAADELNGIISDGVFSDDFKHYYIDNVEQVPTTKYIYKSKNNTNAEYIWDVNHQPTPQFVPRTSSNYIPYRYAIATAQRAVSREELTDPKVKFGIFIYYWSSSGSNMVPKSCYINDIQLTRYIKDKNNLPLIIGNIPDASPQDVEYYYEKPKPGQLADETALYTNYTNDVVPLYNENSVKNSFISVSQSNCFNILQTIAETFECWVDLEVQHDDSGYILSEYIPTSDTTINIKTVKKYYTRSGAGTQSNPYVYTIVNSPNASELGNYYERVLKKFVHLREYVGHDNWAGFKYGININSIERNINSDEIVTKLIVDAAQSGYTDSGSVAITYAKDNPNGENFIYNFDYFSKQGLIQGNIRNEIDIFNAELKKYNNTLRSKELERENLEASLNSINDQRNVFMQLLDDAAENQNKALDRFYELTNQTYDSYQNTHTFIDPSKKLTNNQTLGDLIGELYTYSAVKNSYGGILTNLNEKYKSLKRELKGDETYYISLSVLTDINYGRHVIVSVNDYDAPFQFTLDGQTYKVDVSNKYFSIASEASTIVFNCLSDRYNPSWSNDSIQINDNAILKYQLTPKGTIVKGLEKEIEEIAKAKEEFINNFEKKYKRFIQEGTWSSTDCINSDLYYLDALQVSNSSAQPVISYNINVVEISEIEDYEYYKFNVGDKTYIEDTEFFGWANKDGVLTPAQEEVIVSEVEWHLDDPSSNIITVQNYKTRFEDLFQRISAAVQTVQYNEATYAKISTLLDANGTINQDVLVASMNRVAGKEYALTSDGSIQIHGDEILIHNLTNASNYVMINNEGIKISCDGANTWSAAITGRGINIDDVYTGMLNTNQVIIGSRKNPSFRWDQSGISAYRFRNDNQTNGGNIDDENPPEIYDLQTFVRFDQYGLYGIKNNGVFDASSLSDIKDKAHFAVTWDGFFIKNSYPQGGRVEITSDNDFRITKETNNQIDEKIKIGALEWKKANWEVGDPIYTDPSTVPDAIKALGPSLYGIRIKNNAGQIVMQTGDDGNLEITGTIYANAGEIGGMVVNNDRLTMDTIVLEPGVGIYSTVTTSDGNQMFSISDVSGGAIFRYIEALGGKLGTLDVIDTITVGDGTQSGLIKSYNYIPNFSGWKIDSTGYAEFSNAKVRGHIEAQTGDFTGWVAVGDRTQNAITNPWIVISGGVTDASREAYGSKAIIKTSNYQEGAGYGWMINSDGDAYFNNITARGAIKTAVFEYAEIQAVGGIFIFRPSSTIKSARISGNNLILKVEKPFLFAKVSYEDTTDTSVDSTKTYYTIPTGSYNYKEVINPTGNPQEQGWKERFIIPHSWCKISNYTSDGKEPDITTVLATNGLTHVYKIGAVDLSTKEVTLLDAAVDGTGFIDSVKQEGETHEDVLLSLEGGALIDMGRQNDDLDYDNGRHNYGIGINSSDNTVNLPARAISLFETVIDETKNPKVSYNYKGILGTLPELSPAQARSSVYGSYMAGTQGIYTDNMYIGDNSQYLAFYEDNQGNKHLKISTQDIVFEYDPETETEITWEEKINDATQGLDGEDAIYIIIDSIAGNFFKQGVVNTSLIAHVYKGSTEITNQFSEFDWYRRLPDGTRDPLWHTTETSNRLDLTTADVDERAVFVCEVVIN